MTATQHIALAAMQPGKHYTHDELKRAANLTHLSTGTLRAMRAHQYIEIHDELDPTTYTITEEGLSALDARNTKG